MCSLFNRVIRKYDTPTLFLLAIFGGKNGSIEYPINKNIVLCDNVKHVTEIELPENIMFGDVIKKIDELSKNELTFEGFVLQTSTNERIKAKNKYYLMHHTLKYRGWVKCTLPCLMPYIFDNTTDQIIQNVIECSNYNDSAINELLFRIEYCKKYLVEHKNKLILKIDPFLDETHPKYYCTFNISNIPHELLNQQNNGLATNSNLCYCGNEMNIIRLRNDITRYKVCYCGKKCGYLTYCSGTWLSICSNKMCDCTHEVNQITQKPLGIPASLFCKNLRLHIHQIIDEYERTNILTKDQCYEKIVQIIGQPREHTHMATMGISECVKILNTFCITDS
jgi:hypothetical protein